TRRGMAMTPALLSSPCNGAPDDLTASAKRRTDFKSARSSSISVTDADGCCCLIVTTAARPLFWSRQASSTCAPFAANCSAAAYPIPLLAPVITNVLPAWEGISSAVQGMVAPLTREGCSLKSKDLHGLHGPKIWI